MIDNLRNNIKEFCYELYGDDTFMVDELLKNELKGLGIINGDDEMIWKSPDKSLYFEVSRDDSITYHDKMVGYQYICTINIKNNLSVPICKIQFNEFDAIRILNEIAEFCSCDYILNDSIYIPMGADGIETFSLTLQNITTDTGTDIVLFNINKYNPVYQCMAPVINIYITYEQLNDFAFHMFFSLLIDIETPVELNEVMHNIEDYITTGVNWTYCKRRQQIQNIQQAYQTVNPKPIVNNNQLQSVRLNNIRRSNNITVNIKG